MTTKRNTETSSLPTAVKDRAQEDVAATLARAKVPPEAAEQFLKLHEYAAANHLGLSALAQGIGISSSVLSQGFSGSYPGDYLAVAGRIEKFFWRLEQKNMYGGIRQFAETHLAQALWTVFDKTRVIRRIQMIESPEQLGKTRAAVEYTARNNSGRTVYIKLGGGSRAGAGDFIWTLAEALGLPYTIKLREKRLRIRHALAPCDLVIIDEAHLVWSWSDRGLMEFFDYLRTDLFADGERGVCLIATNTDMRGGINKFRRRVGYNIGQLLGRMRNEDMVIDPAEDILDADVAMLAKRYYEPGERMIAKLGDIARREQLGHFGLIEDVLNEAWAAARAKHQPLTDALVGQTADAIISEMKNHKELYA